MANFLIIGADHEDRLTYADSLACEFLCINSRPSGCNSCTNCLRVTKKIHPNVIYIEPEGSAELAVSSLSAPEIKAAQIRSIVLESQKCSYELGPTIFVITHMHHITKTAANALLKIIEESGTKHIFLLLAPSRHSVLPTIASRLIIRAIKPKPLDSKVIAEDLLELMIKITHTPINNRFGYTTSLGDDRAEMITKISAFMDSGHALLRQHVKGTKEPELGLHVFLRLSDALQHAHERLIHNQNPKMVGEYLLYREWPYAA